MKNKVLLCFCLLFIVTLAGCSTRREGVSLRDEDASLSYIQRLNGDKNVELIDSNLNEFDKTYTYKEADTGVEYYVKSYVSETNMDKDLEDSHKWYYEQTETNYCAKMNEYFKGLFYDKLVSLSEKYKFTFRFEDYQTRKNSLSFLSGLNKHHYYDTDAFLSVVSTKADIDNGNVAEFLSKIKKELVEIDDRKYFEPAIIKVDCEENGRNNLYAIYFLNEDLLVSEEELKSDELKDVLVEKLTAIGQPYEKVVMLNLATETKYVGREEIKLSDIAENYGIEVEETYKSETVTFYKYNIYDNIWHISETTVSNNDYIFF